MAAFTAIIPGLVSEVAVAGQSPLVTVPALNRNGGLIANPDYLEDQGVGEFQAAAQPLYVSIVGPISFSVGLRHDIDSACAPNQFRPNGLVPVNSLKAARYNIVSPYATALAPGQMFVVPLLTSAWVASFSSGHKFTAFFLSWRDVPYPPTPLPSDFPPKGPTGLTKVIPSYLYEEYTDDDDAQEFVNTQNSMQQDYVDTFNALSLPIYTGDIIAGKLLDWVGEGIYGLIRPVVSRGVPSSQGPLNTWGPNWPVPVDSIRKLAIKDVAIADDDFYKRVLTWHYMKGDGKYCSIGWLKRRVMRFLIGVNGTSPPIDETNRISITFGADNVAIRFVLGKRTVTGGEIPNMFGPNGLTPLNSLISTYEAFSRLPYMEEFQAALRSGVLELPFQTKFTCVID